MANSKLHQLLAVEKQVKNTAEAILSEASRTFDKNEHFIGVTKTYKPFRDEDQKDSDVYSETKVITTSVPEKLQYVFSSLVDSFDLELQKDISNHKAKADIVLNGLTLVKDVPATTLLFFEQQIKKIRDMSIHIPTRQPGVNWVPDPESGKYIFKNATPVSKYRTKKEEAWEIVAPATDKHPAQVQKMTKDVNVGVFEETYQNGMFSPAEKSVFLKRIDNLLKAIKEARARANDVEVEKCEAAESIFSYLMADYQ